MAHYYVKTGGNNSLAGTSDATAWATITKVNGATIVGDDIVSFRGGDTFTGQINAKAGTAGHPVTYNSYGTGKATIHNTTGNGIYIFQIGNVTVDNLIFTGPDVSSTVYDGISLYTTTNLTYRGGITVTNCECSGWRHGINMGANVATEGYDGVTIDGCWLHDNYVTGFIAYGAVSGATYTNNNVTITNTVAEDIYGTGADNTGHGFDIQHMDGCLVQYCTAIRCGDPNGGGPSGFMAYHANDVTIRECLAYGTRSATTADGDGFDLDQLVYNSTIEYCLAYDNDAAGFLAYQCGKAGGGNTYRYNLAWGNGQKNFATGTYGNFTLDQTCVEVLFYNNTSVSFDGEAPTACVLIAWDSNNSSACKFYNNIFIASAAGYLVHAINQPTSAKVLFAGNSYYPMASAINWYGNEYTSLAAWRAAWSGQEVFNSQNRGITTDPLLVDPDTCPTTTDPNNIGDTANSMKLLSASSPAFQTGIPYTTLGIASPGTVDYWGGLITPSTPSIGASAVPAAAGVVVTPSSASLVLTGSAPSVVADITLAPPDADAVLTGSAPNVAVTSDIILIPGSAVLPLTLPFILGGNAPSLALTGSAPLVTAESALTPTGAALTVTGSAPSIGISMMPKPVTPGLVISGSAPVVIASTTVVPTAGQLVLTGYQSGVWISAMQPQPVQLTLSGWPPNVVMTAHIGVVSADVPSAHTLEELNQEMLYGDLVSRAMAADELAEYRSTFDKTWVITVYDKFWVPLGELGDDVMEASGILPRNQLPTMTLKVKGGSRYIDTFMSCKDTMVGVTLETGGIRQAYYVDTFDMEYSNAAWVGTANCLGIWDILNYMQIWPNFLLPIQVQIPGFAIFIGPLCTVLECMVGEQALRLQSGLWEFINNALSLNPDIRAWFGTLLQQGFNIFEMLKTPVYVSHTNPFLDGSPLVARTVRMESCGAVIDDLTRAYGVDVQVDLWLPGDEQPDFWTRTIPFLALVQPSYVVTVKDRSQITGPTGTVLDSVIRTVVDIGGSFFGDITPIITQVPGMEGVWYSPILGQHYTPPWAIVIAPDHGEDGSVVDAKLSFHTPKGWQHIVGGRSPKWLNDLINAFTAWLMDSISILIGITGFPSNLLEGFLNNAFFAFQLIEHYGRRNAVGPYHPAIEVFHATASAPYNIETLFAFINALWDSRGYVSGQFTFRDGVIYKLGVDLFPHGLVSLVYHGRKRLFTDYIENVLFRYTPDARDVMIQVGDGKAEEAPLAKHQRFLTGVLESINVVTLAPQSQGFL